ncbi:uncharacterized protein LOC122389629 isoform X1 [Amphibalanus amphitrite]|uniref:uncharacterized protein LOC122389629 isoform X1 n=1 Tax=Amphibalanus amphitrite TaxID=1232801 RepID=UPI001C923028|nr:uncharacterized protein LOC122389629 isoform X1 [Amphibalanus amphitrite]
MVSPAPLLLLLLGAVATHGKARYRIDCEREHMYAIVDVTPSMKQLYLHRLKHFPGCEPDMRNEKAIFHINLANTNDFSACGVTKIVNTKTGQRMYSHQVVIEHESGMKESLRLHCAYNGNGTVQHEDHNIVRRSPQGDGWPSGFQEPEILEITEEITATAPEPVLGVVVRQDGQEIDTSLNVRPGAPLDMEISLDDNSSSTYGIIVSDMIVSDTRKQEELLLTNGCSVDPYLFGNFATETGDKLKANFRAFKFPETNYVLFKGILNVCIDVCEGVQCSNGELGYGRRRRRAVTPSSDPNQVFQVEMSTILNVQFEDAETNVKAGFIDAEEPFSIGYVDPLTYFAGRRGERGVIYSSAPATIVPATAAALLVALLVAL